MNLKHEPLLCPNDDSDEMTIESKASSNLQKHRHIAAVGGGADVVSLSQYKIWR